MGAQDPRQNVSQQIEDACSRFLLQFLGNQAGRRHAGRLHLAPMRVDISRALDNRAAEPHTNSYARGYCTLNCTSLPAHHARGVSVQGSNPRSRIRGQRKRRHGCKRRRWWPASWRGTRAGSQILFHLPVLEGWEDASLQSLQGAKNVCGLSACFFVLFLFMCRACLVCAGGQRV